MIQVSIEINRELNFLVVSFALGGLMMFLYDILRVLRRVISHGTIVIAIEDILYWIGCIFLSFAMFYQVNDGLIRGTSILAIVLGMLLYNHFISRWLVKYVAMALNWIIRVLGWPWRKIRKPLKNRLKKLAKVIRIDLCKR